MDLVRDRYPGKELHSTPMTREAERCQLALELVRSGKTVAMVCSGDSGIYGMAALVYELRGEAQEPEIQVVPGLTAACSAAAVLGAPLTHDFAVISLSDRLTPWETIEKRLDCAAAADLTIALYNPASHGRPDHLKRACDILLRRLPGGRLCGIVRNIGREGQSSRILTPGRAAEAEVDMFWHRADRQRCRQNGGRSAGHTQRIPQCVISACLPAPRRAGSWWNSWSDSRCRLRYA